MEQTAHLNNTSFKRFALIYTAVITNYLLVRAFFNEYLSDETASYWYYAYRGAFYGKGIVLDAANHPLNSLLSHFSYLIFGDVPVLIRIWSVLSYLLYAYFSFKICQQYTRTALKYLAFAALNSVPYMLEYFAYTRGYGLSMGFFMGSVYWLIQLVKNPSTKFLTYTYAMGIIAFSANLTLLSSLFLTGTVVLMLHFLKRRELSKKQHLHYVLLHTMLGIAVLPFILFSFRLKEAGAFYYSSLDGIWDMTGRTLSQNVFFCQQEWLMYLYVAFFLLIIVNLLIQLKTGDLMSFAQGQNSVVAFLFFGNNFFFQNFR